MSRIDAKIGNAGGTAVDASEILAALARESAGGGKRRQDAVSCYLSASDGWREASVTLGGAFAPKDEGLKTAKGE